jgi:hypothetical protein
MNSTLPSRNETGKLLIAFWLLVTTLIAATLMARHWITLEAPSTDDPVARSAFATLRDPGRAGRPLVVHSLYTACGCSVRVLDHLATTERPSEIDEVLLYVGDTTDEVRAVERAGIRAVQTSRSELVSRFHVRGAPLLVVVGPDDRLLYSGGYTERKQGAVISDHALIAASLAGGEARTLPIFGCAVSAALAEDLNPLSIPN